MQTILLQDDPDLFRGLEHSLLCRDGITLLTAAGADLLETCRERGAQVVLLAAGNKAASKSLLGRLESLPHAPLCLVAASGLAARELLAQMESRLGVTGRAAPRRACHVSARVTGQGMSLKGRTRDISASGAFVATTAVLPEDTAITVAFASAGHPPGALHTGVVVRAVPDEPASQRLAGMAIRFAPDQRLSAELLEALPASPAGVATS